MEQKFKYSNGVIEMLGLYSKSDNIFIVILYRQPDDSTGGNRSTVNELRPAIDKLQQEINSFGDPAPNIVICGDFNLPNSSWGDTTSSVPYEREMFDCINQLSNDNFLQQLVTQSTHRGGNTLDLVFTNNDHLIHSHECFKPPLASTSDHYIIECKSRIKGSAEGDGETKPEHVSPLDKLNFFSNDIDWESLRKSLDLDWSLLLRDHPPDRKLE